MAIRHQRSLLLHLFPKQYLGTITHNPVSQSHFSELHFWHLSLLYWVFRSTLRLDFQEGLTGLRGGCTHGYGLLQWTDIELNQEGKKVHEVKSGENQVQASKHPPNTSFPQQPCVTICAKCCQPEMLPYLVSRLFPGGQLCRHPEPLWLTSGTESPCPQRESSCPHKWHFQYKLSRQAYSLMWGLGQAKTVLWYRRFQGLSSQEVLGASQENGPFLGMCWVWAAQACGVNPLLTATHVG